MYTYNSKTHNCIITMGLDDAKRGDRDGAGGGAGWGGDGQSFAPSSIASSFMSRGDSAEVVSVMKLVRCDL